MGSMLITSVPQGDVLALLMVLILISDRCIVSYAGDIRINMIIFLWKTVTIYQAILNSVPTFCGFDLVPTTIYLL